MPLTTPESADDVIARAVADVELALAPVDGKPALKNSWLNALVVAYSNRIFDFYFALDQAALESLPDTAVANLDRWAAIWKIIRTPGTPSTGFAIASGVQGSIIPITAFLSTGDGKQYKTVTAPVGITQKLFPIAGSNLTSVAGVATCVTSQKHELGTQIKITVSGANQTEYNVVNADIIDIIDANIFTYAITGTPASPATGFIFLRFNSGSLVVESVEPGSTEDQVFDVALKFESPITGVDDVARVDFDELGGGATRETDTAIRARLLDRVQNPIAHFNAAELVAVAKSVAGVTRVFVQEITPNVGQVTVYFMRDNDVTSIPSGSEVAVVKSVLDAIRPANSDTADLIVLAPAEVSTDFTFSALSPDTSSMKTAVENNLKELFDERTSVGVDVMEDEYKAAIFGTVDTVTGDVLTSSSLSAPIGNIVIAAGEIGTLGAVTFP
jgi:uncharacterized phage protein gp47/JayE